MDTTQTFKGYFWLPGEDTDRQTGVMRVGLGRIPTVSTVNALILAVRCTGNYWKNVSVEKSRI